MMTEEGGGGSGVVMPSRSHCACHAWQAHSANGVPF
jgi:hypothetical protein